MTKLNQTHNICLQLSMEKSATTSNQAAATKSERAADDLFRQFAEMINMGVLRDGETLPPEREIVETYGVSRTVVREAVQALAKRGLVTARPRYRPVVRKPGFDTAFETVENIVARLLTQPDGVRNLFDTRIMIEAALVRQAAKEAAKDLISELKDALSENERAIMDSELFYQTDVSFHAVLYKVPRNPVLPAVHKAYTSWLSPQCQQMPRRPDRNRKNFEAHSAIFEAILMRDPDAAEDALHRHLDSAWDQIRQTLGVI